MLFSTDILNKYYILLLQIYVIIVSSQNFQI